MKNLDPAECWLWWQCGGNDQADSHISNLASLFCTGAEGRWCQNCQQHQRKSTSKTTGHKPLLTRDSCCVTTEMKLETEFFCSPLMPIFRDCVHPRLCIVMGPFILVHLYSPSCHHFARRCGRNSFPSCVCLAPQQDWSNLINRRLFSLFRTAVNERQSVLTPETLMIDFEVAARNAVGGIFPNTTIRRCFSTSHSVSGGKFKTAVWPQSFEKMRSSTD